MKHIPFWKTILMDIRMIRFTTLRACVVTDSEWAYLRLHGVMLQNVCVYIYVCDMAPVCTGHAHSSTLWPFIRAGEKVLIINHRGRQYRIWTHSSVFNKWMTFLSHRRATPSPPTLLSERLRKWICIALYCTWCDTLQ